MQPLAQQLRLWAYYPCAAAADAAAAAAAAIAASASSTTATAYASPRQNRMPLEAASMNKGATTGPGDSSERGGPVAGTWGAKASGEQSNSSSSEESRSSGSSSSTRAIGRAAAILTTAWYAAGRATPTCPSFLSAIQQQLQVTGQQLQLLQMLGGPAGVLAQRLGKLAELEVVDLGEALDQEGGSRAAVPHSAAAALQQMGVAGSRGSGTSSKGASGVGDGVVGEGGTSAECLHGERGNIGGGCTEKKERWWVGKELLRFWLGGTGELQQLQGRGAVAVPVMLLHVDELMRVWAVVSKYAEARQQQAHLLLDLMQKADVAEQQLQLQKILARWVLCLARRTGLEPFSST